MKAVATIFDIDPARLRFTARTAIAACLALAIGTLIGLDHPQWAAMTVWITALPTRGQRLERSFARVLGTIVGALAGVGLMVLTGNDPLGIIIGLTIWLGLCAGTGNLLTGPASYTSLLTGYSAAMVALLGYGHDTSIWMLAIDRMATACLGAAVGTIVALVFSPKPQSVDLSRRVKTIMQICLDHVAAGEGDGNERSRLILEIAALDESLAIVSAGSLGTRRKARDIRSLLSALSELLLDTRSTREADAGEPLAANGDQDDLSERLREMAANLETDFPHRAAHLRAMIPLWQRANRTAAAIGPVSERPVPQHRDWIGARYAALRSMSAVATTGLVWIATGWQLGPYMVMGAAIMTSVFSTFPNPGLQMRWVVAGAAGGVCAAVLSHLVIMPMAGSVMETALLIMPFTLVGMLPMAHRRVGLAGMDYNLIYLLMMNPYVPANPEPGHVLLQAFGVMLGPATAYLAFVALPMDTGKRLDFVISGGMGALQLGNSLYAIRCMMTESMIDAQSKRALRATLLSIAHLSRKPERVVHAFTKAARKLQAAHPQHAARLDETAALVTANQDFFRRAG